MEQALSAASIAKVEFGKVSDAVVPACRDLYPALAGTATTALVLFDIVKFEIMRDFQQMVSLFTTGMKFPASFKSFWASFSGVFSTCFSCWFSTNAAKVANTIFIVQTLVAIFVFVKFYRLKNRIQPNLSAGLETKSWNMVKEGDKKQIVILTTILTTLFLPVSRDVMQIITCDLRFVNGFSECYTGLHAFEIFLSVLCIIFFIIPTPIVFYHIIERNKPQPSLYDKEGLLREGGYTDANYRDDLKSNLSPFKGLYEPYERRWAYHKVVVMVMKLLIVLPMAIMVASNRVGSNLGSSGVSGLLLSQALATIAVLSVYAIWCWSTRPFLNSTDDVLDGVSRLTILIISLIGLLSSQTDAGSKIFGAFANILAGISSLAAAVMIISGIPKFRSAFKNFREQASFTQNGEEVLVFSKKLSLEKARKLRIWHEFWDVLFAQDAEYRLPSKKDVKGKYEPIQLDYKYGSSPPYLIPFAGTVAERHAENKTICAFESVQSYRSAILAAVNMRQDLSSGLFRDVALLVHSVCGLDVFWDGAVESNEKHSKATCECERETKPGSSQTHFGKAFCVPFPLCVVIRFDDTKEETIFSLSPIVTGVKRNEFESRAQLAQFVAQNMSPEVRRRRQIRRMLRAMDGCSVYHFYQCVKEKTKTRTVKTSEGTKQETYTVHVLFTFRNGEFRVGQDNDSDWTDPSTGQVVNVSRGFRPAIHYNDGSGTDHEGKHWTNEAHSISGNKMGITPDYRVDVNDQTCIDFVRFLHNNWMPQQPTREAALAAVNQKMDRYCRTRIGEFDIKQNVMSYSFWFFVYNNDRISQYTLCSVLRESENNPLLRQLPDKYAMDLTMLYQKLAYFDSHPVAAIWFIFWHDLWIWNQDVQVIQKHSMEFNPFNSFSICYCPLPRPQLQERLRATGLLGHVKLFGLKRGFVNDQILDQLYAKIDEVSRYVPATANPLGQTAVQLDMAGSPLSPNSGNSSLIDWMTAGNSYRLSTCVTASDYDIDQLMASLPPIAVNVSPVNDPPSQ